MTQSFKKKKKTYVRALAHMILIQKKKKVNLLEIVTWEILLGIAASCVCVFLSMYIYV